MSTSVLTLYVLKKSFVGKNVIIEDISQYLINSRYVSTGETIVIDKFQYQKIQKHMFIKVALDQNVSLPTNPRYNYVKIALTTGTYYFFVANKRWISANTVEFELDMDYLNTFSWSEYEEGEELASGGLYQFDDHTKVIRMHKDRGYWNNTNTFYRYDRRENLNTSMNDFIWEATYTSPLTFVIDFEILQRVVNKPIAIECSNASIHVDEINGSYYKSHEYDAEVLAFSKSQIRLAHGITSLALVPPLGFKNFTVNDLIPQVNNTYKKVFITINASFSVKIKDGNWRSATNDEWSELSQYFKFYDIYTTQGIFEKTLDNHEEGIHPILFKEDSQEDEILTEEDGLNSWYIIYKNNNSAVSDPTDTSPTYVNPVLINIVADAEVKTKVDIVEDLLIYPSNIKDSPNHAELVLIAQQYLDADGVIKISGDEYHDGDFVYIWLLKKYAGSNTFDVYVYTSITGAVPHGEPTYKNVPFVEVNGLNKYIVYKSINTLGNYVPIPFYEVNIGTATANTITSWSDVDLSDPKLIKAINIPYAPIDGLTYLDNADFNNLPIDGDTGGLAISNPQKVPFDREILFENNFLWRDFMVHLPLSNQFYNQKFHPYSHYSYNECESKMLSPEFYSRKFVYDSYTFDFEYSYEDTIGNLYPDGEMSIFRVRYVVSKNMLSKFMFQFPQFEDKYLFKTDYPSTLIVDRNNEKALYTNAFINYIKSGGFSYDSGKNERTNAMNGLMTALTLGGAAASFVSSVWTGGIGIAGGIGLATTGISAIARDIHVANENDKALSQKINQLTLQSVNVNSQEDIDLFSAIQGNKAKLVLYEPSHIMKENLYVLFHKYGYAYNRERHLTQLDTHSRLYFNYVQAEVDFAYTRMPSEYLDEIKRLWSEGVTFVHHVQYSGQHTWDVFQDYENWEVSVVNA